MLLLEPARGGPTILLSFQNKLFSLLTLKILFPKGVFRRQSAYRIGGLSSRVTLVAQFSRRRNSGELFVQGLNLLIKSFCSPNVQRSIPGFFSGASYSVPACLQIPQALFY